MVAATLAGLKMGGCMREISKRDIWSPQRIAQERPDIDYQLVAIDFLPVQVGFASGRVNYGNVCLLSHFLILQRHAASFHECRQSHSSRENQRINEAGQLDSFFFSADFERFL